MSPWEQPVFQGGVLRFRGMSASARQGREACGPLPASGAKPPSVALMPAAAFAVFQREQKCPASLVSSFSENPRLWHLVKCAFGKHSELGALTSTPGNTLRRLVLSGSSEVAVGRTSMCSLRPLASRGRARRLLPEAWASGPRRRPVRGTGVVC